MQNSWGTLDMHAKFWSNSHKRRARLGDPGTDIEIYLKEIGVQAEFIRRDHWHAVVITVMNVRVS